MADYLLMVSFKYLSVIMWLRRLASAFLWCSASILIFSAACSLSKDNNRNIPCLVSYAFMYLSLRMGNRSVNYVQTLSDAASWAACSGWLSFAAAASSLPSGPYGAYRPPPPPAPPAGTRTTCQVPIPPCSAPVWGGWRQKESRKLRLLGGGTDGVTVQHFPAVDVRG